MLIGMLQRGIPPPLQDVMSVVFAQKYVNEKPAFASGTPCVLLPFVRKTPASPPAVALIVALVAELSVHVAGESAKHVSLPPAAVANEVMLNAATQSAAINMKRLMRSVPLSSGLMVPLHQFVQ